MSNVELLAELEKTYLYFYKHKGCVISETKLKKITTIKKEIIKRMDS